MKKLLIAFLTFLPFGYALGQGYTWTIYNNTPFTVWSKLIRRGTLVSDDDARGREIAPQTSVQIQTGGPTALGYCVIGVYAEARNIGYAAIPPVTKDLSLTCASRRVTISLVDQVFTQPQQTSGGVIVNVNPTTGQQYQTPQPQLISAKLDIQIA